MKISIKQHKIATIEYETEQTQGTAKSDPSLPEYALPDGLEYQDAYIISYTDKPEVNPSFIPHKESEIRIKDDPVYI